MLAFESLRKSRWLVVVALVACGAHDKDVQTARTATYGRDFATVFGEVGAVVKDRFSRTRVVAHPEAHRIETAWKRTTHAPTEGDTLGPNTNGSTRIRKLNRYFVRFDVTVAGGPPWRVEVLGHASSWAPDAALPVPFPDDDKPAWLETETDALVLAIHRRLNACCAMH